MAKNPQTLGQRVMQRRLELEMSKSELARRVTALGRKCAIQNIRHIENDEVENVTYFGTLAEALFLVRRATLIFWSRLWLTVSAKLVIMAGMDDPSLNIIDRLVSKFGSQTRLGEAAGVGQTAVSEWKKRGFVPSPRIDAILAYARKNGIELAPADFFSTRIE